MDIIKRYKIKRYEDNYIDDIEDCIVVEYLFTIYIDNEEFITLICTPTSLRSLVIGFLHSEGIIKSMNDISSIEVYDNDGYVKVNLRDRKLLDEKINQKRAITTGCGKGSIYYKALDEVSENKNNKEKDRYIDYKNIMSLINKFNNKSDIFFKTGGVHSVGISDFNEILFFEEDIGRHNALDKIIGRCLEEKIDVNNKVILTSGRITSEIILKCAKLNINHIVSRSAATDKAIELARKLNLSVIGFARNTKMNIYNE